MISKNAAKKLRQLWINEYCTVYLRDMNVVTVNEDQQEVRISPMVEGLVIDIDEDFFYLGTPDGMILRTIPHITVGMVEMAFVGGEMIDADMPTTDDEVH